MSVTTEGDPSKEMTLAFELSALQRFSDPEQVFTDAQEWSRYLGVIANDTDAARSYVREREIRQDFELGDRDKWLALSELHDETDTDRHVFVGATEDDRRAARHTGWEFLSPTEVAEKAGWELDEEPEGSGIFDQLRDRFPSDTSE